MVITTTCSCSPVKTSRRKASFDHAARRMSTRSAGMSSPSWAGLGGPSAEVPLHRLRVTDARFVGVHAGIAAGPPLVQQVPALVQGDLQSAEPVPLGFGRVTLRLPLPEVVLLPG